MRFTGIIYENIWATYANGSAKGKVCVVFSFGKLRPRLNHTLQPGNAALRIQLVFSVTRNFSAEPHGIVHVDVEWKTHRANTKVVPNPIQYTYLKDAQQFSRDKELRISLSAFGLGNFALKGAIMQFPPSLQLTFDFKAAMTDGTIQQLLLSQETDAGYLTAEMQ